jgi:excisionase family DNA binding protein
VIGTVVEVKGAVATEGGATGMISPDLDALWTVPDVARYLAVPVSTVYKWRSAGEGPPGFRVGKYVRYRPAEVVAWLEARRDVS